MKTNFGKFKEYVERMKEIRLLSTPDLSGVKNADEYSDYLISNFKRIGELARENRKIIDEFVKPILGTERVLDEEEKEKIEMFIGLLVNDGSFDEVDVHLSDLLSSLLLGDEIQADSKGDENA